MKLQFAKRKGEKKGELTQLRADGQIPAILYSRGKEGEPISLKSSEFQSLLRQVQPGHLSTTVFTLTDGGKERKAIIKEIQYAITKYNTQDPKVEHLDLQELNEDVVITIKVPIECVGVADAVGIKTGGGVLRQVIRQLKVRCLPKDMPKFFELDVRELGLFQTKRLKDLQIPPRVKPVADLNEVAAVIVKR